MKWVSFVLDDDGRGRGNLPLATLGNFILNRSKYTTVVIKVGTWTLLCSTKPLMKSNKVGKPRARAALSTAGRLAVELEEDDDEATGKAGLVGVAGGEMGLAPVRAHSGSTAMTLVVFLTK